VDIIKHIAGRIKTERLKRGLTQEELAYRSGLSRTYISYLEIAQRNPPLKTLQRIAHALGIDISVLFASEPVSQE